jgi:hypothetical protein
VANQKGRSISTPHPEAFETLAPTVSSTSTTCCFGEEKVKVIKELDNRGVNLDVAPFNILLSYLGSMTARAWFNYRRSLEGRCTRRVRLTSAATLVPSWSIDHVTLVSYNNFQIIHPYSTPRTIHK